MLPSYFRHPFKIFFMIFLNGKTWRKKLRRIARRAGYKIHDYHRHKLQMPNGTHINIISPWFVMAKQTGGRRKCGPKKPDSPRRGRHLALEIFGFFNDLCPTLAFNAFSLSVLYPSMAFASTLLKQEGICLSQNKICSLFETFDTLGEPKRVSLSCKEGETLKNLRVCILIDGGRARERLPKKGPIPKEKSGVHSIPNGELPCCLPSSLLTMTEKWSISFQCWPMASSVVGIEQ